MRRLNLGGQTLQMCCIMYRRALILRCLDVVGHVECVHLLAGCQEVCSPHCNEHGAAQDDWDNAVLRHRAVAHRHAQCQSLLYTDTDTWRLTGSQNHKPYTRVPPELLTYPSRYANRDPRRTGRGLRNWGAEGERVIRNSQAEGPCADVPGEIPQRRDHRRCKVV